MKRIYYLLLPMLFSAFLCTSCINDRQVDPTLSDRGNVKFTFSSNDVDQSGVSTSDLHSAPTRALTSDDYIGTIRVLIPKLKVNALIHTNQPAVNTLPEYILAQAMSMEIATSGNESEKVIDCFFVANERENQFASIDINATNVLQEIEALTDDATLYFSEGGCSDQGNLMVSRYQIYRAGEKDFRYRRTYPFKDSHSEWLKATQGTNETLIPITLFRAYSKFTITFQWDDKHITEVKDKVVELRYYDFPKELKLFGKSSGVSHLDTTPTHTASLTLSDFINDSNKSGTKAFSFYFPATSTDKERVTFGYSVEGTFHEIKIEPKNRSELFVLNTNYRFPVRVWLGPLYDVWIQNLETIAKNDTKLITNHLVADYRITERDKNNPQNGGKLANINIGVPYNYRTIVTTKSRLAPANLDFSTSPNDAYWISKSKEISREIRFEDDIPYYYQKFIISYDVDSDVDDQSATPESQRALVSTFEAYNTGDPTKKAMLHASFNVLSRFALMNLGDLNEFANGKTTELRCTEADMALPGKLYQFGRNIAFAPEQFNGIIRKEQVPINNPKIWEGENGIHYAYTKREWHDGVNVATWWLDPNGKYVENTGEGEYKDWEAMIALQKRYGAQDSYVGNNGGDPSPKGYKMPTRFDINVIYYNTLSENFYFSTNIKTKYFVIGGDLFPTYDYEEVDMNPSGNPVVEPQRKVHKWKADYSTSGSTAYSIRFKGTKFATAFRCQETSLAGVSGVMISAIPLDNNQRINLTVKDIKNEAWWNDNKNGAYRREDRFFPNGSYVSSQPPFKIRKEIPDLWSSTPHERMGAVDIDIAPTGAAKRNTAGQNAVLAIRPMRQ